MRTTRIKRAQATRLGRRLAFVVSIQFAHKFRETGRERISVRLRRQRIEGDVRGANPRSVLPPVWNIPVSLLRRLKVKLSEAVAAVSCALGIPGLCSAQVQLPTVNLGLTNFEDGFSSPGWFLEEFPDYYHADKLKDSQGATVPGLNHLTAFSTTTHIAYISQRRFLGGWLAVEALQPWVDLDVRANGTSATVRGFGDLTVGPGLQWAPKQIGPGVFANRFVLDVGVPTGRYNDRRPVNVGNNFVVVDPYYALTYELEKLEFSARLHYLWNSVNHEPFAGSGANTVQPGQAYHMNYSVSYEVITNVRVGFNGYWLQQLTDDKVNDANVPHSLERTFGLGVGMQFFSGGDTWIHLNAYKEIDVRNRAQGASVTLRLSRAIPSSRTHP
jgi:hypothetical protein